MGVDGIVRGEILSIQATPAGLSDAQLASRYRFTVVVKVKFEDVKQGKTLWENPSLSFSDEYELSTPGSAGRDASAFMGQRASRARPHVAGLRALGRERHPRSVLTRDHEDNRVKDQENQFS